MKQQTASILICEDEMMYQRRLQRNLGQDFELHFVQDGLSLISALQSLRPAAVVLDIGLEGESDGFVWLPKLRACDASVPIIIHSGIADYGAVVQAMRLGATDYVPKERPVEELKVQLQLAIEQCRRQQRNPHQVVTPNISEQLVGTSQVAVELRATIEKTRAFRGNILLFGESGVGKEVVARLLRRQVEGKLEPWVDVDSSTIQGSMAESMLFGHERGAFTGAERKRTGLFEQAAGGTIYFDEISNMSMDVQAKLLRVLQEKRVMRLGAATASILDFRVIAATNRNLAVICRRGEFRFDLLSRLDVFAIEIPPLRQRREDIPVLVNHFLSRYASGQPGISRNALQLLTEYHWPGNIRELSNVIQYALVLSGGHAIDLPHLPRKLKPESGSHRSTQPGETGGFRDQVRAFERRLLRHEFKRHGGNISHLARALRMDRSSLYLKLAEHGLRGKGVAK